LTNSASTSLKSAIVNIAWAFLVWYRSSMFLGYHHYRQLSIDF